MPLEKRATAEGAVTVIFRVPVDVGARTADVVGEFTEWTPAAMQPTADGGFALALELRGGAAYRFRYLIDGERWENDWAADGYVANDYGSDDSIVDVTLAPEAGGEPVPPARPVQKAAKKTAKKTAGKSGAKKAPPRKK